MSDKNLEEQLRYALFEDLKSGDITSRATIDPEDEGEATIIAKQSGILSGETTAVKVISLQDKNLHICQIKKKADQLIPGDTVLTIEGNIQSILSAERTALNFLGHLSGIATLTRQFVDRVEDLNVQITDTRKTTPCWRLLEKEAVKAGGGANHRMGLYDMILIKENHIEAAGGIRKAVQRAKLYLHQSNLNLKIEVETSTMDEVSESVNNGVDRIMLDNMSIEMMKKAVNIVDGNVEVEASGGVDLDTVRSIAETGVDYISVGALTHSAPSFDFSLLLKS